VELGAKAKELNISPKTLVIQQTLYILEVEIINNT